MASIVSDQDAIAIDVVVLPMRSAVPRIIACNRLLAATSPREAFDLSDGRHAPHITLCQTFVAKADVDEALDFVKRVVLRITRDRILPLQVTHVHCGPPFDGVATPNYAVAPNATLLELHETITRGLEPLRVPGTKAHFYERIAQPASVAYANAFHDKWAFGKTYFPHITLGAAEHMESVEKLKASKELNAAFELPCAQIAVYQLGDYCTCARKLTGILLGAAAV